jgi:hypothetical protein
MPPAGCLDGTQKPLLPNALLHLLASLQALCANIDALLHAIGVHPHALQVSVEASLGVPHGVADIVAELRPFAANFAPGHWITPKLSMS